MAETGKITQNGGIKGHLFNFCFNDSQEITFPSPFSVEFYPVPEFWSMKYEHKLGIISGKSHKGLLSLHSIAI